MRSRLRIIGVCEPTPLLVEAERVGFKVSPSTCLDVGTCSKLRTITLEGGSNESLTISNLVTLLYTLRDPQKPSRIRVFVRNFSFLMFNRRSPLEPEVWERLDGLLCRLCPKTRKGDGEGLSFQIASRKATVPVVPIGYLLGLLPEFSRIGTCEEVEC